jgi:hypothetical protein
MKFNLTERGGNLFDNAGEGNDMIAWLPSGEDGDGVGIGHACLRWIEVSYNTENYPSLQVRTVDMTEAELAAVINERLEGYWCRKCNIKGVALTGDKRVKGSGAE